MRKKIWSFILTVCLLLALTPDTVIAATMAREVSFIREAADTEEPTAPVKPPKAVKKQPAAVSPSLEGNGTAADPYRIRDAAQLRMFADAVNGVGGAPNTGICAVLTQNINLSGICGPDTDSWTPIGTNANPYRGTFDGGSFSVSGLYCHKPGASYAGLFAANAGIIKNLGVAGGSISAGNYVGGLCGINRGTITGCYNTASVSGARYTGGICGYNDSGATVSVCYNTSAVNGSKYVGGICGYNKNATSDCYNTGTVTGSETSIGGICGYNKKLVSGCYNTGEVGGGTSYVGSLCGYNHSGSTFVNCYYLITGTEKGNYGVGMTQQQFASGEVCYALNAGNGGSVVWKQTCGTGLPGFGGKTVYRAQTYKSDGSTVFAYTNDSNKKVVTYTAPTPYTSPTYASSGESTGDNSDGHTHVYKEPEWNWKKYESAKATLTCQDCGEEFILKASIKKEVTEPTCTEAGETVYKASVEKDGITFKDKRVVEKEKTGHALTIMNGNSDPNAEQTCAGPIYTETFYMCTACKKCFKDEKGTHELTKADSGFKPALKQHTYDLNKQPEWDRPSAENIATAIFSCTKCTAKTAVAATVKSKITKDATCVEDGKRTYTSNVRFKGTTYPGLTWEEKISAIGHNFKLDPKTLEYKCSRCNAIVPVGNNPTPPTPAPPSTTKDVPDSAPKDETLPMDETLPGDEDPSLPPGAEETQETPTPSEEQDGSDEAGTPETPDGSGNVDAPGEPDGSGDVDAPGEPDGSGEQDTPDNPDTSDGTDIPDASGEPGNSDGQDTPNTPDKSDASGSADISNAPGESDTSDGADVPPVSDEPGTAENAEPYGLLCPEEGALTGTTVSLHSNAAVKSVAQPAGEQQELFLWGSAIVLMLIVGVALLIILQKKQN